MTKHLRAAWYVYLTAAVYLLQLVVFIGAGGAAYIYDFDHLDLFAAHYELLRRTGTWFSQDAILPILGGVPRDLLGSELELYNLPYVFLPGVWAYFTAYVLRVAVGFFSFYALARDFLKERYAQHAAAVVLCACAFSLIPVFPSYACAFTSLPLIVLLLRRIYYRDAAQKKWLWLYPGVFVYPTLSYFSYHGIFILAYLCLAVIILWIHDKKLPLRLLAAVPVLSAGYVLFEYRLFREMFFSDTLSIRPGISVLYLSFKNCLKTAIKEFIKPFAHSQDAHTYLILCLVLAVSIGLIARAIRNKKFLSLFSDPLILTLLMIGINCLLMGFYHYEPLLTLVETLLPKLKGFDFSRASFLNPFLWYAALLLSCVKLGELYTAAAASAKAMPKLLTYAPGILSSAALLIVCFLPDYNNDFALTLSSRLHKAVYGEEADVRSYDEFYSVELFDQIKEDIDYRGEWCVSFGLYPAILCYNHISTLDGYLGLYSQEYKDIWKEVIAPAGTASYHTLKAFAEYGNKVYLAPADDANIYEWGRKPFYDSLTLKADMNVLRRLGLRYLFAPVPVDNAAELGFAPPHIYTGESSPYTIYLYELK